MKLVFHSMLAIHILAGAAAFLIAPLVLAVAKGGKTHRRSGMIYLWMMGTVAASAVVLSFFRPVYFLAMVAVFSFYFAFSGYRVLKLKSLAQGGRAKPVDWTAATITLCASLALLLFSFFRPAAIQVMPVVGVAFGLLGTFAALGQLRSFIRKPREKMFWWYTHLGNFIGSYIAAWSAFSAVVISQLLGNHWYVWLWPVIVGVPCIIAAKAYYRRKFTPRPKARSQAQTA